MTGDRRRRPATDRPTIVLLGGPSAEHDVSIVSGTAIADALREAGRDVVQVLIDLAGRWWWLPPDHRRDVVESARSAAATGGSRGIPTPSGMVSTASTARQPTADSATASQDTNSPRQGDRRRAGQEAANGRSPIPLTSPPWSRYVRAAC